MVESCSGEEFHSFLPILIEQEYRGGDHGNSIGTRVGNSIEKTPLKKAQTGEIGFAELFSLKAKQSHFDKQIFGTYMLHDHSTQQTL